MAPGGVICPECIENAHQGLMTRAEVMTVKGKRAPLDYMFTPLVQSFGRALREGRDRARRLSGRVTLLVAR